MINIPVTYEHDGIFDAVDDVYRATGEITAADVQKQLEGKTGRSRPVGSVVAAAANGTFIARIDPKLPLVSDAIRRRIFSVSLTHVGETLAPLELSLVRDPARVAASIRASYKGDTLPFDKTIKLLRMADAPATTPAAPMESEAPEVPAETPAAISPIEAALSLLEPKARAVLEDQLRNYESQAQRQEKALDDLEKAQTQDRDIATALANDLMEKFRAQGLELPLGKCTHRRLPFAGISPNDQACRPTPPRSTSRRLVAVGLSRRALGLLRRADPHRSPPHRSSQPRPQRPP
jgi:hypothetical protein